MIFVKTVLRVEHLYFWVCCLSVVVVQGCSGTPSALFWTPLSPTSAACPPLLLSRLLTNFSLHSSVRWDVSCCVLLLIFYWICLVSHLITYKSDKTKTDQDKFIKLIFVCLNFLILIFFAMPGVDSALFFIWFYSPNLFQNSPYIIPWDSIPGNMREKMPI